MGTKIISRLMEVPTGWENGGDLYARFDGLNLIVEFGEGDRAEVGIRFKWVRSFRYVSEATYDGERDDVDVMDALLTELALPDEHNPSNDYYGDVPEAGKGPPRLFRVFHYKAGLIEVVASDWHVNDEAIASNNVGRNA